ncbi:hypothetical protein [Arthronema virus TR020]|uniref:Uncharacterized protein n=1 Tax=Arthronema virus TR020 TaxID=2736280 RepID=A0A7G3WH27_9CAUD|nr:hypothetical protein [Arthronema virus TR020]
MDEEIEYKRVSTRVDISDDELRQLLVKHQHSEPLSREERNQLMQFFSNFTRNLERRYFGKQDNVQDLDLHHERLLYVHDYMQQRRRFERQEEYELLPNGKLKLRSHWKPAATKSPPFSLLYKLKLIWHSHEANIRLAPLGIDFSNFGLTGERNRFEMAETTFFRFDVVSVLKVMRLYEIYDRDTLIQMALDNNPLARRFRKWTYAKEPLGVEPFVDTLLFAVGHRYGYKQLNEGQQAFDYFKPVQGTTGRKIWTQSTAN